MDLKKFYDQINVGLCIKAANAFEFTLVLLVLGLEVIFGPAWSAYKEQ